MSIYLPTPPFETDPKIYSWKEVLGEKSSDIRFGGKYENALEHYCSSSPSERLRPKLGFLWKPIRHYCFSPRWQHTNLNRSYLGTKSFSQDQQIWMLYLRKSFSEDQQIWICHIWWQNLVQRINKSEYHIWWQNLFQRMNKSECHIWWQNLFQRMNK